MSVYALFAEWYLGARTVESQRSSSGASSAIISSGGWMMDRGKRSCREFPGNTGRRGLTLSHGCLSTATTIAILLLYTDIK